MRKSGRLYCSSRQKRKPENGFEGLLIKACHSVTHGMGPWYLICIIVNCGIQSQVNYCTHVYKPRVSTD